MQTYLLKFTAFLGFLTKKYYIFNGSEFSTKGHNNSWCLLFPTTRIFQQQFTRNENWLWFFEGKFVLFDKWLRPFEDFLDNNLLSLNLPRWFSSSVASMCKLYDKLVSIYITVLEDSPGLLQRFLLLFISCLKHCSSYTIILWSFLGSRL